MIWHPVILALAAVPAAQPQQLRFEGDLFGPSRALTCTWFTNFENSRFERCRDAAGYLLRDGASIRCARPPTCEAMERGARRAARWHGREPVWGTFTVQLVGRISLNPRVERYLGDRRHTVLVEEVTRVRVAR